MSFDTLIFDWRGGEERIDAAPPGRQPTLHDVADAIVAELRRRLGGAFTVEELVELHGRGTDWTLEVAQAAAPDAPWAWEASLVTDAAFGRYLREATDYAGGRLLR